jgi:hypothetical protein
MAIVDITGIDKLVLLKDLWKNSKVARFFKDENIPPPSFNDVEAKQILEGGRIDYFCGRLTLV